MFCRIKPGADTRYNISIDHQANDTDAKNIPDNICSSLVVCCYDPPFGCLNVDPNARNNSNQRQYPDIKSHIKIPLLFSKTDQAAGTDHRTPQNRTGAALMKMRF